MSWFKREEQQLDTSGEKKMKSEGLWVKCEGCRQIIWKKDLEDNFHCCPKCEKHFRIDTRTRLGYLFDDGVYTEEDGGLETTDPLEFTDLKAYKGRVKAAQKLTGRKDAIVNARGKIDGREVIRILRKHSCVTIIALSSRDREPEKIATLDLGADDFVCKPIKLGELMARVRAALRARMRFEPVTDVYQAGHITIDAATRTVTLRDQSLRLTMKEFDILHILATVKGRVVKQRQLLEMVWGSVSARNLQYLRVFIGRLRAKIEDNPAKPTLLVTERGVGYRLIPGDRLH